MVIALVWLSLAYSFTFDVEQIPIYGYPTQTPYFSSLVYHENLIYCFGGVKATKFSNNLSYFNLTSLTWSELLPLAEEMPTPRMASLSFAHNQKIFIFGGNTANSFLSDLWSFDISQKEWKRIFCFGDLPIPRKLGTLIKNENSVYLYGGDTSQGYDSRLYE